MSQKRKTVMIPSEESFINNKYVSDRVYAWILLNGFEVSGNRYEFFKKPAGAYKEIGINYRTLYRRLEVLHNLHYIEDTEDLTTRYITVNDNTIQYKKYVYKDIIQQLYNTGLDNIIKVYVYLCSLYDVNNKKGVQTFFRLNTLSHAIGYSDGTDRDTRTVERVEGLVKKLAEMKLITYKMEYKNTEGHRPQVNYILLNVNKG